jgi:hypothetical protein
MTLKLKEWTETNPRIKKAGRVLHPGVKVGTGGKVVRAPEEKLSSPGDRGLEDLVGGRLARNPGLAQTQQE